MIVSLLLRRTVIIRAQNLIKPANSDCVSLRHIAGRGELVGLQLKFASSDQFSDHRTFCKDRPSNILQAIICKQSLRKMSDDTYSSFLDQANQDTGASKPSTKSKSVATKAVDTDVPVVLQEVDQYYTSESDEPFVPVSLKWSGKNMPSENEFGKLIEHKSEVSTLTTKEFDPQGEYKKVMEAVERSGDGKTRIYRVEHDRTRVEYYVVSFDKEGGKIVGLKAQAVES
ncbi:hypothetical protein BDR22DRAFT_868186 [Usnea florida]